MLAKCKNTTQTHRIYVKTESKHDKFILLCLAFLSSLSLSSSMLSKKAHFQFQCDSLRMLTGRPTISTACMLQNMLSLGLPFSKSFISPDFADRSGKKWRKKNTQEQQAHSVWFTVILHSIRLCSFTGITYCNASYQLYILSHTQCSLVAYGQNKTPLYITSHYFAGLLYSYTHIFHISIATLWRCFLHIMPRILRKHHYSILEVLVASHREGTHQSRCRSVRLQSCLLGVFAAYCEYMWNCVCVFFLSCDCRVKRDYRDDFSSVCVVNCAKCKEIVKFSLRHWGCLTQRGD